MQSWSRATTTRLRIVTFLVRALAWTWRVERVGQELLDQRPAVLAFLHRDLVPAIALNADPNTHAVVSASRDGEWAARILARLGYGANLRGSSSRRALSALSGMREVLRSGERVAIAIDGPRGPAGVPKPGAAWAARFAPLVGVRFEARRYVELGSWDRTRIPWPFTRVRIVARRIDAQDRPTLERDLVAHLCPEGPP